MQQHSLKLIIDFNQTKSLPVGMQTIDWIYTNNNLSIRLWIHKRVDSL